MSLFAAASRSRAPRAAVARAPEHLPEPSPVLDLAHLRRFTGGNVALEREVLELFVAQTPTLLRDMQLAKTTRVWRDAAHTLKGSAYAIGANVVAGAAADAESTSAEPQRWPEVLKRLERDLREVETAIAVAVGSG